MDLHYQNVTDSLVKLTLNYYFKGGAWHFKSKNIVDRLHKVSNVVSRLRKEKSNLSFMGLFFLDQKKTLFIQFSYLRMISLPCLHPEDCGIFWVTRRFLLQYFLRITLSLHLISEDC